MTFDRLAVHGVHAIARAAFQVLPPLRAKSVVERTARWAPPLACEEHARAALLELGRTGSCLTRAATIASMLVGGELVIGVAPTGSTGLMAHAWVALNGQPVGVDPERVHYAPIAQLPTPARLQTNAAWRALPSNKLGGLG